MRVKPTLIRNNSRNLTSLSNQKLLPFHLPIEKRRTEICSSSGGISLITDKHRILQKQKHVRSSYFLHNCNALNINIAYLMHRVGTRSHTFFDGSVEQISSLCVFRFYCRLWYHLRNLFVRTVRSNEPILPFSSNQFSSVALLETKAFMFAADSFSV